MAQQPDRAPKDSWHRLLGYRNRVVRRLKTTLPRPDLAEDAANDGIVKALRDPEKPAANLTFSELRRYSVHSAIDYMRRAWTRREREFADGHHDAVGGRRSDEPHVQAESAEIREAVANAISKLTPTLRVVFVMYYMQGKSTAGIAVTLGIEVKAVEQRRTRAREALQQNPVLLELMQADQG